MKFVLILFSTLLVTEVADAAQDTFYPPPGSWRTSWVGNSYPGDGGPNGFGFWVQNGADEIEVTPDGTVIAGTDWDEAGRCAGLYKDGKVNRVLLKQEGRGTKETAWGWNTGNHAIAVDGTNIYIANTGKRLLRFAWTPGDLDSARVVGEFPMSDKAVGLSARDGKMAIAYTNQVEIRQAKDFAVITNVTVPELKDVVIAPDNSLWVIAGTTVKHLTSSGAAKSSGLAEVAKPTALAFDCRGQLIVCDDGPDQQVKFFDVRGPQPKLVSTFGEKGGLTAGRPGVSAPTKLYAPRGAGTDKDGNLYVALGFNGAPVGTLVLRSFTPDGKLRWELANHAFVDTYGFDPAADGAVIYSRTAVLDYYLDATTPSPAWRQRATTVDHVNYPDDPRANSAMTVYVRHLQGRRLLYGIGQYGGGFRLFAFNEPDGWLAHPVGRVTAEGETWAWHVAENGDIWHGDAPGKTTRRHAFRGWNGEGKPEFETRQPDSWPWPEDFQLVRRVIYDQADDTLYLSGYLQGETIDSWGVCGKTLRRYDGWLRGRKESRWTIKLPLNPDGEGKGKPLSPESLAVAGDYLFVGMVKPDHGKQHTHIIAIADGSYVGSFVPGPEVGGNAGWQDMPYAVAAVKRKNGEYLVLVEEDWRGKNLLYRWTPNRRDENSAAVVTALTTPQAEAFIDLLSVDALPQWRQCGPGRFAVTNGVATGEGGMGLWWYTGRQFTNFVLRGEFVQEQEIADSGVYLRFPDPGQDPWVAVNKGHEMEIGDPDPKDPTWRTGSIYPFAASSKANTKRLGQWNTYEITCVGHQYTVRINDELVTRWTDTKERTIHGFIGLQNYHDNKTVRHRKLRVQPLP